MVSAWTCVAVETRTYHATRSPLMRVLLLPSPVLLARECQEELVGTVPAHPAVGGRPEAPLDHPPPLLPAHASPPAPAPRRGGQHTVGWARRTAAMDGVTTRGGAGTFGSGRICLLRIAHYEPVQVGPLGWVDMHHHAQAGQEPDQWRGKVP